MHALAEFILAYDESEAEQASKAAEDAKEPSKEVPKASPSGRTAAKAAKSQAHAGSRPSEPSAPSLSAILAGAALTPSMLPALVRNFAPGDGPMRSMACVRQHDAQEFCMYLIDALHQELEGLALRRGLQAEAGEAEEALGDEWLTQRRSRAVRQRDVGLAARTPTLAHALFQGVLESSVAASGQPLSITRQPFTVLGLHIANPKVRSLADAMSVLTERELILGYRPSKSKQPVDATKRLSIYSLPPVLVLHLMRFGFGIAGTTKIERYIAFEQELEICSSWLSRDSKDRGTTYELFACVTHHGKTVTSGHYTADVLQTDGRWLRYDDAAVCRVHPRTVLGGKPYILFYRAKTCK
ncbi:ubiquitin carboxyl-terminal hydrolase [Helicosporidium sp. ATCC 50920]|nr:ubiquitin carboxyl-terminal hydrolase [Helicosporidium sp. ATCC 50920]|eukprot:KDD76045.1 ubiquitin carboxyl-terminal hydrolase [Helicosporidium sp. ATCC 50920]